MWDWAIYGALLVGFLAVLAAAALLAVRVLRALRDLKRLRRGIGKELERLADLGEATADKLGTATDTAKVDASVSRLRADLARLAILREAIDEAKGVAGRLAWIYPRA